ncbi:hypothetical protein L798_13959 [Zootermopsis nevadensis]|uniref:Uncharacterized protein n=2 Tax=Zootermopsis nevadensis TaxID=136037 RepID=A0A067R1W9_ZOONE|nr:hypothetical protein L798_13959 [Zootermopsis nevadensis]
MATVTLHSGSKRSSCNGITDSESKELCTVAVARGHIDRARKIDETEGTSLSTEIKNLLSAATIEEQLHILKDIAKNHLGNGNECEKSKVSAFCIQLLIDIYVAAAPKDPFKCAIARIFMALPEEAHTDVAVCLSAHLIKLMSSDRSLVEMNSVIAAVGCCFDNFPIGVLAATISVLPALRLIKTCLKYCIMELSHSLPPAKKMEICHIVHSSLRTAVSLLQKCQTKVKELVYSERYCKEGYLVPDMIVNLAALLDMHCNLMPGSTDYSESDGI